MEIHGNWGDLSINVIFLCSLRVGNLMTPLRVCMELRVLLHEMCILYISLLTCLKVWGLWILLNMAS